MLIYSKISFDVFIAGREINAHGCSILYYKQRGYMYNVQCTMCIIKSFCYDQNEYLAFQANMDLIHYLL